MSEVGRTRFLNVDLLIRTQSGCSNLLSALGDSVFVLYSDEHGANLELLGEQPESPESAIVRFSSLITRLSGDAREEWNRCQERILDVGILPGEEPHETRYRLAASTLALAASMGADVAFTVYGLEAHRSSRE
jgi:hypothetical protein